MQCKYLTSVRQYQHCLAREGCSSLASLQAAAVLGPFCASPATGGAVPKLGQPEGGEPSWFPFRPSAQAGTRDWGVWISPVSEDQLLPVTCWG